MTHERNYDVIVVGTGHAGCEAAAAAARLGARTLLIGLNLDTVAWMPCNPAIGGPAKSHLVKEIDALGGLMGRAADATYLQLKTLNSSRGAAVHSLRAQSDKYAYSAWVRQYLQACPNLSLYQAMVQELLTEEEGEQQVRGVVTALGEKLRASAVVLTGGTFIGGRVFTGSNFRDAGRASEPAATGLGACIRALGLTTGRLKTGTPPRLDARSVDFDRLSSHPGDMEPSFFSFLPGRPRLEQLPCHSTRTTTATHDLIRDNLHLSPLYAGLVAGRGPRYCPSIEDKLVRFPDRPSHQLFLEPEGRGTSEIYLQGFSTSLPVELQWQMVRTLPGLEVAEIVRPAYAVEYDFLHPNQFHRTLAARSIRGLYAAGQLLGSSGYEEASAQGLVAGLNAALEAAGRPSYEFSRAESYIGTLIDDLIAKDIDEPYRLMTSRSEYRLHLRQDNADRRLTPVGRELGLVGEERWSLFEAKREAFESELRLLRDTRPPVASLGRRISLKPGEAPSLSELLRRPEVTYDFLDEQLGRQASDTDDIPRFEVETEIKYSGYVDRQCRHNQRLAGWQDQEIPRDIDFERLVHLSAEAREKLSRQRPRTIGQAGRIAGVSPADLNILLISLARRQTQAHLALPS